MKVITIEHETFQQLTHRLDAIEKAIAQKAEDLMAKTWLGGDQVLKLLSISRRTLQTYRDQGKIGFSQVGKKFYYRAADIQAMLDGHYIPATTPRRRRR